MIGCLTETTTCVVAKPLVYKILKLKMFNVLEVPFLALIKEIEMRTKSFNQFSLKVSDKWKTFLTVLKRIDLEMNGVRVTNIEERKLLTFWSRLRLNCVYRVICLIDGYSLLPTIPGIWSLGTESNDLACNHDITFLVDYIRFEAFRKRAFQ